MKKDGYKITLKVASDCMPTCTNVFYPIRNFKNLEEILDYAMNRYFNPRNKPWKRLEFVYSRDFNSEDLVFNGYPRTMQGSEINIRLSVRIENIVYCNHCKSVFPKFEYPELRSGFEVKHLSCKECGRNFRFG